jgi:hypothetical protein
LLATNTLGWLRPGWAGEEQNRQRLGILDHHHMRLIFHDSISNHNKELQGIPKFLYNTAIIQLAFKSMDSFAAGELF